METEPALCLNEPISKNRKIISGLPKSPDDPITTQKLLARLYIKPHTMRVEPEQCDRKRRCSLGSDHRRHWSPLPIPW